jgi:hypothetical protein
MGTHPLGQSSSGRVSPLTFLYTLFEAEAFDVVVEQSVLSQLPVSSLK